jgi:Fic family protein
MRSFDYSFLEYDMFPANLINIVSKITELQVRENQLKENYVDLFLKLESIAKVQSVKGSNEIEGIVTSEQRIHEIVNQNSAPLNHNEEEIAGYRDALSLIHGEYTSLDIRESDIQNLHRILLSYTNVSGGIYKTSDNLIMETDSRGWRRVRFDPVPALEVDVAMEQMTLAYLDARSNYNINQLLLIPCYILDFLCIHPFAGENGRISRLLTLLLLYKNGFDAGRYMSFEGQINHLKDKYYLALEESSVGWHDGNNSYVPFIMNFATTLLYCYKELDKRFAVVNSKKISKQERVRAVVLGSLLPISKSEICYILPDVSMATVELVLSEMHKTNIIKTVGKGKNTKYVKQ